MVMMVLLKEAWICAIPWGTFLRSFFLKTFFLPFFSGAPVGAPVAAGATGLAIVSSGAQAPKILVDYRRPKRLLHPCDQFKSWSQPFSCWPRCLCADPYWYGRCC